MHMRSLPNTSSANQTDSLAMTPGCKHWGGERDWGVSLGRVALLRNGLRAVETIGFGYQKKVTLLCRESGVLARRDRI